MIKDEIVEKVRKNREELFSEFDYDLKRFSQFIFENQKKYKDKLVAKPFKKSKQNV